MRSSLEAAVEYRKFKENYVPYKDRYDHITNMERKTTGIFDKYDKLVIYSTSSNAFEDILILTKRLNQEDDHYLVQVFIYLNHS